MSAFNIRIQCLFLANYSSCILLFAGIMSSAQTGPADPICTRKILFLKCYGNILVIFQVYTCYIPVIYIQKVYAWYIPGIYMVYDHLCRNPGIYIEKTLWEISVPVTYPSRHVISQEYSWSITCLEGYVTGTEISHKVFSMYIPGLRYRWSYTMHIPGIYQVYFWYRHVMYEAVIMLIAFLSFLPAGFRGQHFAVPSGGSSPLDSPRPDPNDDEDNL